ncbi:hypothetical protein [Vulgatibacter incomptus]|uniref:Uncharacterized protein n=1 Tax=Vulgatibacter incomptus TaxID=1391653 RepID=A0A0K1PIA1_9BACT|nr:hypothetical protein [Vulgatibacter incomptus]AKU92839.1 hypothetical protein AKJ08_3226 [Vulgatibacter incomptus]
MALPFHLCQPGGGASCGACCGLYNFRDHSRGALTRALRRRTETIRALPKEAEAYRNAARSLRRWDKDPFFDPVRLCPLLGFLDDEEKRVGCMAHPLVTGGVDLRDCGAYDSKTCSSFECPSFLWLNAPQARLVRAACPDWYLYGLVITDVELVRGSVKLLEAELGGPADLDAIVASPSALEAARELLRLKETALGRPADAPVFGRFARDDMGEPIPRAIEYEALGASAAPEDDVVLCLGYAPPTHRELESARALVREKILALAGAVRLA